MVDILPNPVSPVLGSDHVDDISETTPVQETAFGVATVALDPMDVSETVSMSAAPQQIYWPSSPSASSSLDSSGSLSMGRRSSDGPFAGSVDLDFTVQPAGPGHQDDIVSWIESPAGNELLVRLNSKISEPDVTSRTVLYQPPSLIPTYGHDSFELLGHYVGKTASSMNNGFISSNPFLSQFIPLAFSNELILQLLLTQSAAHRASRHDSQTDDVALSYYGKSTKLFRQKIKSHINGNEGGVLVLAVGALIMCFTEVSQSPFPTYSRC